MRLPLFTPVLLAAFALAAPSAVHARPAQASAEHGAAAKAGALQPALAGMGFLVGEWSGGAGQVADTGGTSTGRSTVTVEVGGAALLRRDHTELRDKAGRPTGGFDQIMLIYAEGDAIRAEYADGTHVIHYVSATVEPRKSATFLSAGPGPVFKLTYTAMGSKALGVAFAIQPPGAPGFQPIATGTLTR